MINEQMTNTGTGKLLQTEQITIVTGLATWDDVVQLAAELRSDRDRCSWALGDLTLAACDRIPGRPAKDSPRAEHTVSALAYAIGEERAVLSALAANAEFWPAAERAELPLNVSWRQCAEARRRSGWRVGAEITEKQKEFALTLVYRAADVGSVTRGTRLMIGSGIARVRSARY